MNIFSKKQSNQGVTLIELMIALSIFTLLTGLVTVNLSNIYSTSSFEAVSQVLMADLKSQQMKAMLGDTEGRTSPDAYGVYFESNKYILFHGFSYVSSDPYNFPINLDGDLHFSTIMFPSSSIIFSPLSGETLGYVNGADTVTLQDDSTGRQKIIQINRLGVISNIY